MANAGVVADPEVMMGKPVVAGTCITVQLILEKLSAGERLVRQRKWEYDGNCRMAKSGKGPFDHVSGFFESGVCRRPQIASTTGN
jgi:hypothetical protein